MQTARAFFHGPVPELPPGASVAPQLPNRPIQWRRAWRLMSELRQAPEATGKAFEMMDAIGGRGDDAFFLRFAASEAGHSLLRERPSLLDLLADREALAAMPEDSFGRAYLGFARENGFAADGLIATRDGSIGDLNDGIDEDRLWFFDRITLAHDLWHVLTGYATDEASEVALLAFSHAQGLSSRAIKIFLAVGASLGGRRVRRFMREARRRGQDSVPLLLERYEELLPLPLDTVRARLGIAPLAQVHPEGGWRRVDGELVPVAYA